MSELAQPLTQQLAQRAAAGQVKQGMQFAAEFNRQWAQAKTKMFEMADAGSPRIHGKFSVVTPSILAIGAAMGPLNPNQVIAYSHPEMKAMYKAGHLKLSNVTLQCDEYPDWDAVAAGMPGFAASASGMALIAALHAAGPDVHV